MRLMGLLATVVLGNTCAVLGIDSTGSTCLLLRVDAELLLNRRVAPQAIQGGEAGVLIRVELYLATGQSEVSQGGWLFQEMYRLETKARFDDKFPCCRSLLYRRNYLDEAPSSSLCLQGNNYYLILLLRWQWSYTRGSPKLLQPA